MTHEIARPAIPSASWARPQDRPHSRRRVRFGRMLGVTWWAALLASTPTGAWAGLKDAIAAKFNVDPNDFVLNLPPRPGCLPGSVFTKDLRVPISRTAADDPKLDYGPLFQFTADVDFDAGGSANVGVASWLGLSAGASSTTCRAPSRGATGCRSCAGSTPPRSAGDARAAGAGRPVPDRRGERDRAVVLL